MGHDQDDDDDPHTLRGGQDDDNVTTHRFGDPTNVFRHHKFYLKPEPVTSLASGMENKSGNEHDIFVQLNILDEDDGERKWKETARWIKYEEDVEEGADRWGRAHISSLSFYALIGLSRLMTEGIVLLDLEEDDFSSIASRIVHEMVLAKVIHEDRAGFVIQSLLLKHKNINDNEKGWKFYQQRKSLAPEAEQQYQQNLLQTTIDLRRASVSSVAQYYGGGRRGLSAVKDSQFMRQISMDAQASVVLVGIDDDNLNSPMTAFIRLAESSKMPNITEVPIPVKFLFILLGPSKFHGQSTGDLDYKEIGRSIATLMSNKEFHEIAYNANHRGDILQGIHEYLNESLVLPPCEYEEDLFSLDDLRSKNQVLKLRKQRLSMCPDTAGTGDIDKLLESNKLLEDGIKEETPNPLDTKGLSRTRRFFGGLVNDVRRRYSVYASDIKDGINFQCLAAIIFISCAQISGTIAFGGLMDAKTEKRIGISETLLASSIGGIVISLLAGQPLLIAATTGPLLLFDASLFTFCQTQEIDFLAVRTWIGIWLSVIGFVFVAFEASVLIRFFTRFTQEVFAVLISLLFIAESLINLYSIYNDHPLLSVYGDCEIDPEDATKARSIPGSEHQPNTALLCTILMFGTFTIAWSLNEFRSSHFLTKTVRNAVGNFAVPIAIIVMVLADYLIRETVTKKLDAPGGLQPTYSRDWLVNPGGVTIWMAAIAILPSLLLFILLFMEVAISELIMSKAEYRTKKGGGFHLDILLICVVNTGTCFLGLPWISVALVRGMTHMSSLTIWSTNNPPGQKPVIIGIWEQRVTNLVLSILTGASVVMAPLLSLMPIAVIFGVFFFMGVGGLRGIQFFERFFLFFKQVDNHPQVPYVRRVPTSKMHLYTIIQLCWLAILWGVNYSSIALSFPFVLIILIPFRFFILPRLFKPHEIEALDSTGDEGKEKTISET